MSNEVEAAMQALQALRDIADRTQDPNQLAALEGLSKLVSNLTSEAKKLDDDIAARCQRFTAQCMIGGQLAMPSAPGPSFAPHPSGGAGAGQLFPGVPYPYVGAGLPGPVIYWPPGASLGQPGGAVTYRGHPYGLPRQPYQFAGQQTNAYAARQHCRRAAQQAHSSTSRTEETVAIDVSPSEVQQFLSSPAASLAQPQKNSVTRRASHVHTTPEGILASVVLTRTLPTAKQSALLQVLAHDEDAAAGDPGFYLYHLDVLHSAGMTPPISRCATQPFDSLKRAMSRFHEIARFRLRSGYTVACGDLRLLSVSADATPSTPQHTAVQVQPKEASVPAASQAVKPRSPLPPWMSAAPFKGVNASPAAAIVGPLNGGSLSPSFSVRLLMPTPRNMENHSKFFILQVILDKGRFVFFRAWGRTSDYDGRCQSTAEYYDSVERATKAFAGMFMQKTGNPWPAFVEDPASFRAVPGRYVMESYLLGTKTISAL